MTQELKGAPVVEALNQRLISEVVALNSQDIVPTLTIVRVGEREDDISYERGALKRMEKIGIAVRQVVLPQNISEAVLIDIIKALNIDDAVHGVLLFRPLPKHISDDKVRSSLVPEKDIDGITDLSLASIFTGGNTGFAPCTAQACVEILDFYGIEIKGKHTVVIGRSLVIGKPVAMMLLSRNATVTLTHSQTFDLPNIVRQADIVIACVGRAKMVDKDSFASGQVIIDVGINVTEGGTLVGDVDFESAQNIVTAITPVPGGVGTVTTSILAKHVIETAKKLELQRKLLGY